MHQHPRPSTRAAVPATAIHPNSPRQPNTRDIMADRTYSSEDLSSGSQTVRSTDGKEQSLRDKANLVVQHFFTKAALIICSSRVSLPPAMSKTGEAKIDRWVRTSHHPPSPASLLYAPLTTAVLYTVEERPPCLGWPCVILNLAVVSLPGTLVSESCCRLCHVSF